MRGVTSLRSVLVLLLLPIWIGSAAHAHALQRCMPASSGCPCADEADAPAAPASVTRACCCEADRQDSAPAPAAPARAESTASTAIAQPPATALPQPRPERIAVRHPACARRIDTGPPILLLKQSFLI
jgi:hypothetical protein